MVANALQTQVSVEELKVRGRSLCVGVQCKRWVGGADATGRWRGVGARYVGRGHQQRVPVCDGPVSARQRSRGGGTRCCWAYPGLCVALTRGRLL